jgi:hypothetical protein
MALQKAGGVPDWRIRPVKAGLVQSIPGDALLNDAIPVKFQPAVLELW